jgi:hypothetical protein
VVPHPRGRAVTGWQRVAQLAVILAFIALIVIFGHN